MKTRTRTTGWRADGAWSGLLLALLALLAAMPATADETDFDYQAVDLRVAVWVDKAEDEIYQKGSYQTVGFQSSEDSYAVVYRIDAEGEVTVLWPRSRLDDGFVFGGHEYELPVSGDRRLRVSAAEGEGYVEAIVSRYPFDLRDLELDFHHEPSAENLGFRVAGDPFLAMNEINFAITGMEDAGDYVVTNYVAYYVHQEVEHPRYLCNQCHFEDDTAYHPYRDTCQLDITVDYRWGNTWWDTYGYYPVYASPVYVYVDPWTWRPWVNFWYDPWWVCPPVWGCSWPRSVYVWHDSGYYRGNCNVRYRDGIRGYRPLTPSDQRPRKVREYRETAPMLADGRTTKTTRDGKQGGYEGKQRSRRENPAITRTNREQGNGGLRIRDGFAGGTAGAGSSAGVRHASGGTRKVADLKTGTRRTTGRRTSPAGQVGVGERTRSVGREGSGRTRNDGGLRTVEPRNKGTRIWSLDRNPSGQKREQRTQQVRPGGTRGSGRDASKTRRTRGSSTSQPRKSSGRKSEAVRGKSGTTGGGTQRGKAAVRGKSDSSGSRDATGKGTSKRSGGSNTTKQRSGSSTKSGGGGRAPETKTTRTGGTSSRNSGGGRSGKRR